jgi:DNA-binding phage protein
MNIERYGQMFREAEGDAEYWYAIPATEFVEDVLRRMEDQKVSRAELARRLGTTRAYVTKLLRASGNFKLITMVKVAMALNGVVHNHISDRMTVTLWRDVPQDTIIEVASVPGRSIGIAVTGTNSHKTSGTVTAEAKTA